MQLKPHPAPGSPASLCPPAGKLPAPELLVEPATLRPAPGSLVQLRCRAPRAGLRFALVHEDAWSRWVHSLQSPAGAEAHFELRDVSPLDSANYSCVYVDTAPPFEGSAPSARVELRVDGERHPRTSSCPARRAARLPWCPRDDALWLRPAHMLDPLRGLAVGGPGDAWRLAHIPGS